MDFILAITLFFLIIMSFSIVQGAPPTIVQNVATMNEPYTTGYADSYARPKRDANATAEYDATAGFAYASANASESSNAWAYSYLEDAFEIIHSSDYNITFSFNYKGLAKIIGITDLGTANAKVDLTVYLIDRNDGEIISQKTENIADFNENIERELVGPRDLVLTIPLEENHVYDWRAELRTEASATPNIYLPDEVVEATTNFFDIIQGYRAEITQVRVEDLNPDSVPPTTTSSLSGTEGENGWYTSSVTISLSATDTSYGVDYTNQRINGGSWNLYTSPFTISSEGTTTVDFYSVDKANNKENTKTVSIKIDKTAPHGSVLINGGDAYSSSRLVTLSLTYADAISGVSKVRYSNDGVWDTEAWENPATTKYWTLTPGDGIKTVYYQIKDNAGNISPETYGDIILDTEPPTATILINQGDEYTNSTSVTLYMQYSDNRGIYQVRYSNDGVSYTPWEAPSEIRQWTLLPGDGVKTVYAQFRDWAGLNSNFISDKIILDTIPPTGSIEINNGASNTTSTSVTVTLNATDTNGVAQMRLRNDGANWSAWEEVKTKTWNITSELGSKTVFAQFKDNAGLISQSYNATINLVAPEPSPLPTPSPTPQPSPTPSERGNVIVYVKDENNNPISGATVTSTVQPTTQSPLNGITDSQGSVTFNNIITGSYSFRASKGSFSSNDVQVNVKSQQTASAIIILQEDLTEPSLSVTLNPEDPGIPQKAFIVTAEDNIQGSGIATITLYIDDKPVATWTTAGTHTYENGVYSNGTHTYYAEAVDKAGNSVRNPSSGYLEFTVTEGSYMEQTELWKLVGVVLVLANGTALVIFSRKRKK